MNNPLRQLHFPKVLANHRLWITIFAIGVMFSIFCHAEHTLKEIATEKATVYESMYQTMMWGVVTVAVGFTGFGTLAGFSRNVSSTASLVAQNVFNKSEATSVAHSVEEKLVRIVQEGDAGSPEVRPFTQHDHSVEPA